MIICVCNGLRDTICRETAANRRCFGPGCIYRLNGARVRCGRCVPMMREIYSQHAPHAQGALGQAAGETIAVSA